jgi:putative ABC transport system substrate-binding protein
MFTRGLAELGWTNGRNLRMDVRWDGDNVDRQPIYAKELVDLQLDVILASTTPQIAAFQQLTRTIPIVFAMASDPLGSGFVASLSRPGGNITGFMLQEVGGRSLRLDPGAEQQFLQHKPSSWLDEKSPGRSRGSRGVSSNICRR